MISGRSRQGKVKNKSSSSQHIRSKVQKLKKAGRSKSNCMAHFVSWCSVRLSDPSFHAATWLSWRAWSEHCGPLLLCCSSLRCDCQILSHNGVACEVFAMFFRLCFSRVLLEWYLLCVSYHIWFLFLTVSCALMYPLPPITFRITLFWCSNFYLVGDFKLWLQFCQIPNLPYKQ